VKSRIGILDSFRAIAIILVIFYHFFSRYNGIYFKNIPVYPYGNRYDYFGYGYLGVQLFFIISGFVIYFTIDNSNSFIGFWKRRLIRLLPTMVFASIITFLFFSLFDNSNLFPNSHKAINFIPSWSFISPNILNDLFHTKLSYISGSYWSLWPEVQFYAFISILYFSSSLNFTKVFIVSVFLLIIVNHIFVHVQSGNKLKIPLSLSLVSSYLTFRDYFNLLYYIPLFSIGVFFYMHYKYKKMKMKSTVFLNISTLLLILYIEYYFSISTPIRLFYLFTFISFYLLIYFENLVSFLEVPLLSSIGESSYFLYLIHENIGIYFIFNSGKFNINVGIYIALVVSFLLVFCSYIFTRDIEKKVISYLKTNW